MNPKKYFWLKLGVAIWLPIMTFGLVFVALADNPGDFATGYNLSRTGKDSLTSGVPQIAAKSSYVAMVWSDAFNERENPSGAGHIFLKSANESQGYWRAKTPVYQAPVDAWGRDPAFVFDHNSPTTVHVVWSQATGCVDQFNPNGAVTSCDFQTIFYKECNIADDINECPVGPIEVAQTSTDDEQFLAPQIAVDDDGDLHVIWLLDPAGIANNQYRYARSEDVNTWSAHTAIAEFEGQQDVQLLFTNDRLHFVWDNDNAVSTDRLIKYAQASDDTNSLILTDEETFRGSDYGAVFNDFRDGNTGNPSLTALGNKLLLAFDVENFNDADEFGIFYAASHDNGLNWSQVANMPLQNSVDSRSRFDSPDPNRALKPQTVISSTGTMTQVFAVWHEHLTIEDDNIGFARRYRIRFSHLDLDAPLPPAIEGPQWSDPLTITLATEPTQPHTYDPGLALTHFVENNVTTRTAHLSYQRAWNPEDIASHTDVFYQGNIVGTIDPEYILGNFFGQNGTTDEDSFKLVQPTIVETDTFPIIVDLNYVIAFTNTGNMDAIGVRITDTLPTGTTLNPGSLQLAAGTGQLENPDSDTITWAGNVPADSSVKITFSVRTTGIAPPPTTVINTMEMWSIGSRKPGRVLVESHADTIIAAEVIFLPIMTK